MSPSSLPRLLAFGILLLSTLVVRAATPAPEQARFGRENYVEYRPGELPLILTSGHGGDLAPAEIADRTWGSRGTDRNTREITFAIADQIAALSGGLRPHVIVSHLRRLKLDPNRPIEEAAQGDPRAEQAWREFHEFIATARAAVVAKHERGLLIDVHGHGHALPRVELGYALGREELDRDDHELDRPEFVELSTLRPLSRLRPHIPLSQLVRGPESFGDLLLGFGLEAWPSSRYPRIGEAEFYRGGYIVRFHSRASDPNAIAALQAELPFPGFRDTEENRARVASALAASALTYLNNPRTFAFSIPAHASAPAALPAEEEQNQGCGDDCAPPATVATATLP